MPYLGHMHTYKGMTNNTSYKLHISILNIFHNFGKDTNYFTTFIVVEFDVVIFRVTTVTAT